MRLIKRIDVVYLLGLFISLIGYYFKTTIFLNGDFFYGVSSFITPVIGNLMVFLGILIILIEFVVVKHYKHFYTYLIEDKSNRNTLYVIIGSIIAYSLSWFILSPKFSFYLVIVLLFVYVIYFLILKSSKFHILTVCLLTLITIRNLLYLNGSEYYEIADSSVYGYILVFYLGFLITIGVLLLKKRIKKNNTLPLEIVGVYMFFNSILTMLTNVIYSLDFFSSEPTMGSTNNPLMEFSNCPNGYGSHILTEGDSFNILCVQLDTGLIAYKESGLLYLALVYLGLIFLTILLKNRLSSKRLLNKGVSLKEYSNVSEEFIDGTFRVEIIYVREYKFERRVPLGYKGKIVDYPGNTFIYDKEGNLLTDCITISKNYWKTRANSYENVHVDDFSLFRLNEGRENTISIYGYVHLYEVDVTTWEVVEYRQNW